MLIVGTPVSRRYLLLPAAIYFGHSLFIYAWRQLQMVRAFLSEIPQTVEYNRALVNLYALDDVRMGAQDKIGSRVNSPVADGQLIIGKRSGNEMDPPVK